MSSNKTISTPNELEGHARSMFIARNFIDITKHVLTPEQLEIVEEDFFAGEAGIVMGDCAAFLVANNVRVEERFLNFAKQTGLSGYVTEWPKPL